MGGAKAFAMRANESDSAPEIGEECRLSTWITAHWRDRRGPGRIASKRTKRTTMAKAYWLSIYRSISDPDKVAAYAKLAGPAIVAGGGRTLARGVAALAYEAGLKERTVLIEFDSLEAAEAAYKSPAYQDALTELEGGAEREIRIVEGL